MDMPSADCRIRNTVFTVCGGVHNMTATATATAESAAVRLHYSNHDGRIVFPPKHGKSITRTPSRQCEAMGMGMASQMKWPDNDMQFRCATFDGSASPPPTDDDNNGGGGGATLIVCVQSNVCVCVCVWRTASRRRRRVHLIRLVCI